ncbi:MAG: HEPN domain-containing protein [Phycisphaerae bacterium]|nr:HEPN domain-containing protein [Phycisphaerae bacterium]
MKETDRQRMRKVAEWLAFADDDIRLARHAMAMESPVPYRLVAYHAQQCAEKHLKAFLVSRNVDFPYTHNISTLLELCTPHTDWSETLAEAEELTPHAITTRYPGLHDQVGRDDVTRAMDLAERVRKVVREALGEMGREF